jgi:hypothetical protein
LLKHCHVLSALIILASAPDVHAQLRSTPFEHWSPPQVGAANASITLADSVRVRVGSHAGKGTLIGAAIGGALGLVLGLAVGSGSGSCSDCASQPSDFAVAAGGLAIGAGAGGLIGLLAGLSSPRYEWRQPGET